MLSRMFCICSLIWYGSEPLFFIINTAAHLSFTPADSTELTHILVLSLVRKTDPFSVFIYLLIYLFLYFPWLLFVVWLDHPAKPTNPSCTEDMYSAINSTHFIAPLGASSYLLNFLTIHQKCPHFRYLLSPPVKAHSLCFWGTGPVWLCAVVLIAWQCGYIA